MNSPVDAFTGNRQLRSFAHRAVDDVPYKFIGVVVPIADEGDRSIRRFFQHLVAAMFLCCFRGLVRIDLQESHVEHLRRRVRCAVTVFGAGIDAARRRTVGRTARPRVSPFPNAAQPRRNCRATPPIFRHGHCRRSWRRIRCGRAWQSAFHPRAATIYLLETRSVR